MLRRKEVIGILREKWPYLRDNFGVERIGLFGSFAKGTAKEDSDIDILIEFAQPIANKYTDIVNPKQIQDQND